MVFIYKWLLIVFLTILSLQLTVFPQSIPDEAVRDPLSTVFYLINLDPETSRELELQCLASSLTAAGRSTDLLRIAETLKADSYINDDLGILTNKLIDNGKHDNASKLLNILLKRASDDLYSLEFLIRPFIRLNRDKEIMNAIEALDDSDKIDGAFKLAEVYIDLRQPDKALSALENVADLVKNSEYGEDRAKLAFYFSKIGKEDKALHFLQIALKELNWKTGKAENQEGRVLDLAVQTYRALGKYEEALDLTTKQGEVDEEVTRFEIAREHFRNGEIEKAKQMFESLLKLKDANVSNYSYDFLRLIELYVMSGSLEKAEALARSLTSDQYYQQQALIKVADSYINIKGNSRAKKLLKFALEQTKKIDISKPEDGRLWTSPKMDQARYQADIAERLIKIGDNKTAISIISKLKKPYLKALSLAEYVAANGTIISHDILLRHLEDAESLLKKDKEEIFDERRYDVYGFVAGTFAKIGYIDRSDKAFADALSLLDRNIQDNGIDSGLLYGMCSIGVEFEKAKIGPAQNVTSVLRQIVKNWEAGNY